MRLLAFGHAVMGAALLAATASCIIKDNNSCLVDKSCPVDAQIIDAVDAPPVGCRLTPSICEAPDLNCVDNQCVDCNEPGTQDTDCTDPAAPICGADNDCRGCELDSECGSDFCDDGVCVPTANVIYLAPLAAGVADINPCTITLKCTSLPRAMMLVDGTRKFVRIASGAYPEPGPRTIAKPVTVHAAGAILSRVGDNEIIHVNDAGGPVILEGLTARGATGNANADGIRCTDSTLTLRGVTVEGNAAQGLDSNNCILTMTQSTVLTNRTAGLLLVDGRFAITNSYFIDNGRSNGAFGGLSLTPDETPNSLEFNTISKNIAQSGNPGALTCAGPTTTARNNLIYGSVNTTLETMGTTCVHSYSVIGPMNPPAGTEVRNLSLADIGFVDENGLTAAALHISATSMLKDSAAPGSTTGNTAVDFDGDARPSSAATRADIGADEIP